MKRFLALLATGALALGLSSAASAQTRGFAAGAFIMDDLQTPAHTVTLTAPVFGSAEWLQWQAAGFPNLQWSVPVPPAANAQAGFVFTGPLSGAVIPHLSYWVPPGQTGFNNNGGYAGAWDYATKAQLGIVSGSGTPNQITKWAADGVSLIDAGFDDNGTVIHTNEALNLGDAATQGVLRFYEVGGTVYTLAPSLGALQLNNDFAAANTIVAASGGAGQVTLGTSATNEIAANDGTINTPSSLNVNAGKFTVDQATGNTVSLGTLDVTGNTRLRASNGVTPATATLTLSPTTMVLGDFANIVFADPDATTGPMEMRYFDNADPSVRFIGGSLQAGTAGAINYRLTTATGNTTSNGTLDYEGTGTFGASNMVVLGTAAATSEIQAADGTINTPSSLNVNAGKLTVASATGNTDIAGGLGVTGTKVNGADAQASTIRATGSNGSGWQGLGAFGGTTSTAVIGELSGLATIGAHNPTLATWSNLYMQTGGGNVRLGPSSIAPTNTLDVTGTLGTTGNTVLATTAGARVGIGITAPNNQLANATTNITDNSGDGLNVSSLNWQVPNGAGGGYAVGIMNNDVVTVNPHGLIVKTASTLPNTRVMTANAGGSDYFQVWGNGNVNMGVNTATSTQILSQTVTTPNIGSVASASNVLVLNGGAITKSSLTFPTGSGTLNTIPKWTPSGSELGDSKLTDDGTTLSYNAGKFTVDAATGNTLAAGQLAVNGATLSGNALDVLQTTGMGVRVKAAAVPPDNLLRVEDNTGQFRWRVDQQFDQYLNDAAGTQQVKLSANTPSSFNLGVTAPVTANTAFGPTYGADVSVTSITGSTSGNTDVFAVRGIATEGAGEDDRAYGGDFEAVGNGTGGDVVGGYFRASGGTGNNYAIQVGAGSTSLLNTAVTGSLNLNGANSPLLLNSAAGNSGDVLTSAAAGATPTWTAQSALVVNMGGDVTGTSAASTVAKINGATLGSTTATDGNVLVANGSQWNSVSTSGDVTIANTGAMTIGTGAVTSGKILDGTIADGDLAGGVYGSITGLGSQSQALNMGANQINGVAAPTLGTDAANKTYVDNTVNGAVSGTINTMAKFTAANVVGNSALTDNGTTLSYSGTNVNSGGTYQIGGTTVLRTPGTDNTFLGANAGTAGAGNGNTALGAWAGATLNGSATANVAIGEYALMSNSSGTDNTVVGEFAAQSNSTGSRNTIVGKGAMQSFGGAASQNVAIGWNALSVTTANNNVGVGLQSLTNNSTGSANTAIGFLSGFGNSTGGNNVYVGNFTGFTNNTGSNLVLVGNSVDVAADGYTNSAALGNGSSITGSNMIQLGNASVTNVNTSGRYTTTAGVTLSGAASTLNLNGSVGTSGNVLTSAGAGATPTWTAQSAIAAGTAATLSPGRNINGVLFDGSANITVAADMGTLTGTNYAAGNGSAITNLTGANVTGNIPGNAAGFTGSLSGDVTGTQGATVVSSVADGALSTNVPLKNASNTFTGATNTFKDVSSSGHVLTTSTITAAGAFAGIVNAASATGSDVAGTVTLTTNGTAGTGSATITFGTAYASAPVVVIVPANAAAVATISKVYVTSTTTTFTVNLTDAASVSAGAAFNYIVVQ